MNSEVPSPESDNTNFDEVNASPAVSQDIPPSETNDTIDNSSTKSTSDLTYTDIWLDDDDADDVIDVASSQSTEAEEVEEVEEIVELSESEPEEALPEVASEFEGEESTAQLSEPELFADRWLDESESDAAANIDELEDQAREASEEIARLEQQKAELQTEVEALKTQREQMLLQQLKEVQEGMGQMVEEGTKELKERKMALQIEVEKLERRKERINQEMRSNFAGSSKELAIRVQGFKEYLVGSLQDLVTAAEKLELARVQEPAPRRREVTNPRREERRSRRDDRARASRNGSPAPQGQFREPTFADRSRRIRQLLDKYRNSPDYYGSPWQLRRTFEAQQAEKVQDWFFVQGGRGAIDSMGSRLQNILVASAVISILYNLYGDRCRVLVLTDTPENLGEWRKGLQDCLGISRNNFGTNRGVVLFDSPDVLVQRAERLVADKLLPVIIIDETEELLNLSILKFPLWLAFASTNRSTSANYLY